MLERKVEKYLVSQVHAKGGKCLKWSSPAYRGVPDRIVFLFGQVWFIELKRPGGKLSKLQEYTIDWMKSYTKNIYVLDNMYSVDAFILNIERSSKISLKSIDSGDQISHERSKNDLSIE